MQQRMLIFFFLVKKYKYKKNLKQTPYLELASFPESQRHNLIFTANIFAP